VKLVTFKSDYGPRLGALLEDRVLDLQVAAALTGLTEFPSNMQALIESGDSGTAAARALIAAAPSEALLTVPQLLAPLPRPVRLRDCSLFLEHMEVALEKIAQMLAEKDPDPDGTLAELRARGKHRLHPEFRKQVIYYNADHLHVYGPDSDIVWPLQSQWADYELEWACVVGKSGQDIPRATAREHIFGFTIFNDWSARDIQIPFMAGNLGPGEGKDFANSLGPCIATFDEFADPYDLRMTAKVNGEQWSYGSTKSMYHRFEDAIVQFSSGKTLYAGEVIASGTVLSGCGFELGRKLNHDDVVALEVEGIGTLRNRVLFAAKLSPHIAEPLPVS
jgi:2-keto-4-pentenoate hydratase/2-oxohepta-3-ene-1,7-dioic acid hydratase in catechol pathway